MKVVNLTQPIGDRTPTYPSSGTHVDVPRHLDDAGLASEQVGLGRCRDGCLVPLPWTGDAPGHGFSDAIPWLPIPSGWDAVSVAEQDRDPSSPLALHRRLVQRRSTSPALIEGSFAWLESPPGTVVFERIAGRRRALCRVNVDGDDVLPLPEGEVLARSAGHGPVLEPGDAAWLRPA
jgi:alpha-glucosidase